MLVILEICLLMPRTTYGIQTSQSWYNTSVLAHGGRYLEEYDEIIFLGSSRMDSMNS